MHSEGRTARGFESRRWGLEEGGEGSLIHAWRREPSRERSMRCRCLRVLWAWEIGSEAARK